jgi:hypothetical protein
MSCQCAARLSVRHTRCGTRERLPAYAPEPDRLRSGEGVSILAGLRRLIAISQAKS